ncbi:MAG TPA: hypothetical protein DHV83_07850 [Prevotella sp.]|nr:hypothetical protein [Prevotella sp.]
MSAAKILHSQMTTERHGAKKINIRLKRCNKIVAHSLLYTIFPITVYYIVLDKRKQRQEA